MPAARGMEERIAMLLRQDLGLAPPSYETDLLESGVLDSLGIVELILRIEETFGVKIAMDELDLSSFRSITAIAAFVQRTAPT